MYASYNEYAPTIGQIMQALTALNIPYELMKPTGIAGLRFEYSEAQFNFKGYALGRRPAEAVRAHFDYVLVEGDIALTDRAAEELAWLAVTSIINRAGVPADLLQS